MSENEGYFNELGDPIVDYMERATQDDVDRLRTFLNGLARANFEANWLPGSKTLIEDAVENAANKLRYETKKMMVEDVLRGSIDLGRIK